MTRTGLSGLAIRMLDCAAAKMTDAIDQVVVFDCGVAEVYS